MTRFIADLSLSLDGFVTGPAVGPDNGLGTGGEVPSTWTLSDAPSIAGSCTSDGPGATARYRSPAERVGESRRAAARNRRTHLGTARPAPLPQSGWPTR